LAKQNKQKTNENSYTWNNELGRKLAARFRGASCIAREHQQDATKSHEKRKHNLNENASEGLASFLCSSGDPQTQPIKSREIPFLTARQETETGFINEGVR